MSEILKLYKNPKLTIINIYIFCTMSLILFKPVFSSELLFEFKFSKFLELNDDNYFICTEKGIYIYDSELKYQISQYNFTEEITEKDEFELVTMSQYSNEDGGEIIAVYKNRFFLFSSSGVNLIDCNITIEQSGDFYALVPYKKNSEYNIIICYIGKNYLFMIDVYEINISEKSINLKKSVNPSLPVQSEYISAQFSIGPSCHIMNSDKYGKVLTCFYMISNAFSLCSFDIEELSVIDDLSRLFINEINPYYIKSDVSKDKTKALICFLGASDNNGHCINYNINKHEISKVEKYIDSCTRLPSGLKVYYSKKTKEFIFACYDYISNFTFVKFDENFLQTTENKTSSIYITSMQIIDCYVHFFSIVYLYNYSFLVNCDNTIKGTRCYSLNNDFNSVVKSDYNSEIITSLFNDSISSSYIYSSIIKNVSKTTNNYYYNEENSEKIVLKENQKCPDDFLYENKNSNECLKSCNYSQFLKNNCFIIHLTSENINIITKEISYIINNTDINPNTNIVIEGENAIYQIISSLNMNVNENKNISIIDFGKCEEILKEFYNIDYLLILKIDTKLNNYNNILNYEIYNPNTKEKLNLSLCNNIKINTKTNYFPSQESLNKIIKLNESGYDLYNINNSFYNDLCTPFTTDNGTDILLSDRINDYYENLSLCENGCNYKQYDYISKIVECECSIKKAIVINETEINNDSFFSSFIDVDNFSNIKVLKCFYLVFSKIGITNNIGSYIFLSLLFSLIVLYIIFTYNQIQYLMKLIRKIIKIDYNNNILKNINNNKKASPTKKKKHNKKNSVIIFKKINDKNFNSIEKSSQSKNIFSTNSLPYVNNMVKRNVQYSSFTKDIFSNNYLKNSDNNDDIIKNGNKKNNIKENKYKYNDEELNSLDYDKAIKYDKRTYFQYYFSLIKQKHLLIFTFFNNVDYNIFIIKFALFIFSFSLFFSVNALFFVDSTMHNIYKSKGKLELLSQIPDIFYSTVISSIISIVIKTLALSNKDLLKIKQINNTKKALKESSILLYKLKIKFNLFFLISFILTIFFWYFISAFCAVYKNTQVILIENTLSSFGVSLLYPLGLNLIPGLLRIPALKSESKNLELLYKLSKLVQLI